MRRILTGIAIIVGIVVVPVVSFYAVSMASLLLVALGFAVVGHQEAQESAFFRQERAYRLAYDGASEVKLRKDAPDQTAGMLTADVQVQWFPDSQTSAVARRMAREARLYSLKHAERECMDLLATIATDCRVVEVQGAMRLRMKLEITPSMSMPQQTFWRAGSSDALHVQYSKWKRAGYPGTRRAIYDELARHCASSMITDGSCSLGSLNVITHRATNDPDMTSNVAYSSFSVVRSPGEE